MAARKVCVGVVIGAKGVRGEVRIKSFTEVPGDVAAYGPVATEQGRTFRLKVTGASKDAVIVKLDGIVLPFAYFADEPGTGWRFI